MKQAARRRISAGDRCVPRRARAFSNDRALAGGSGGERRMNMILVVEQALNGIQLGVMLFLISAGLTLVFSIMNLINLAHGVLYMLGAYIGATVIQASGSFWQGIAAAIGGTVLVGIVIEILSLRALYGRSHLDQVLVTFGLTLFFNELVRII